MVNINQVRPKLYVMDNGKIKMDKNLMIASSNTANIDYPNAPNEMIEFPVYTVLIDHPEGKILFDTACNPNSMGPQGRWPEGVQKGTPWTVAPEECYLHNRLEQLNVRPEDIKYVVASHLHLDHAGCLEWFTNATIIVHDDELNGALRIFARNQSEGAYIWADINAWIKNNLQFETIKENDDNLELVNGVKVLNFGSGHAFGLIGLQVDMPETGSIILASDAIYNAESYGPPIKPPGIIYDSLGWGRAVEKIRRVAKETNSDVWFGHDADQFSKLTKSTEGYYE
ncbi:N-acyl homoserine lactonase family protein [Salicibibacter cibi]|uniref:N-acyl homoserine lactonase family protein n=1 Tax=Salicibibacter cibi TaxID=2743001 RepID=A0A7T6ZD22_9BACI|nr:N-acyl homoserine lactonase family protein [Salicibibacter cibi]QQK81285.1 N-acyl homoserine lactonase family protein [Salicibibacter cibi]